MKVQKQFSKEEVTPILTEIGKQINQRCMPSIDPHIAQRLKASRVVRSHGSDGRVLQFHCWIPKQVFDNDHFKYEVQHDPVPRYTGTTETNWAIQFYMNITRVYHERDLVIERLSDAVQPLRLEGFQFEKNKKFISLIYRFSACSLDQLKTEVEVHLPRLINAVHPVYCEIVDAFGVEISDEERRKIVKGTIKTPGLNRYSTAFGSAPEFNRNVPSAMRKAVLQRDGFRCRSCGHEGPAADFHVDHILPVCKGGLTKKGNLQTLCAQCNLEKGGKEEKEGRPGISAT